MAKSNPQKPVVLLVDDEPFNLDVLEQELEDHDLVIATAANGQEALAVVAERAPDMIFLDLMMPVMDGFAVLAALQANPEWQTIPVVIVSAASDMGNIVRGIELGATDFLPKPFEPAILHARLNAGLERKRLRDLEQQYLKSLERELEIGREIQAGFLPQDIPQPAGWRVEAYFQAAREVAGDFYDVFAMGEGKLGLLLGDVTDKGVGSALFMALFRSLLRAAVGENRLFGASPSESPAPPEARIQPAIAMVNRYICEVHDSAMYATLFFGVLDTATGELAYVSAGHDPPFQVREDTLLAEIKATGPAVGMFAEAQYRLETLHLAPGDRLALYSDGIPDAQNAVGEMFGIARFRALLTGSDLAPAARFAGVIAALRDHLAGAVQFDDVTLLVVARD